MRLRRQPYCRFFATTRRSGSSLLWPVMTTSLLVYSVTVVTAVAANLNTNSDDIAGSGLIIGGSTTSLTTDEDQQQQEPQQSTLQAFDTTVAPQLLNESSSLNAAANSNFYPSRKERPPKTEEELILKMPQAPLGTTASGSPVKPTKYHYYPHNQHIYLLPECAVQQVCNAVYVRLNYTQPLCACPSRYREPCSASLNSDDLHTTELSTDPKSKVLTLVKTCEPVSEMRLCRNPRDWSLLALQNVRTGKSHYLVICRCPDSSTLEGPMSHDQPTYASVPGIKVYGMVCISKSSTSTVSATNATKRKARPMRQSRSNYYNADLIFPWNRVEELIKYVI